MGVRDMKAPKVGSSLDKIIVGFGFLSGILVVLNGVFVSYEVIMRYFFNAPTIWVTEVTIYLVTASTFFALAYVLLEKAHVKVDCLTNCLSPRTAVTLEACTSVLAILYCLVLDWESAKITYGLYTSWEVSPTLLKVPIFIPNLFILFGSLLLTVQFIRHFRNLVLGLTRSRYNGAGYSDDPVPGAAMSHRESGAGQLLIPAIFLALLVAALILLRVSPYLGLLVLFFVLLFSGIPVAFALGLFGVFSLYLLFGGSRILIQVPIMAYSTLDSPIIVALPLFVLTSCVLRNGQVGVRIYGFANVLVRHVPGGLGIASVIFCCLFAAMTGNSVAVAATVSLIALPEMLSKGYSRKFVIGLLAAGGTLGILFPPSLPLMIYSSMTSESLGSLFLATLIPGLILAAMFCLYVVFTAWRDPNIKREPKASFKEILAATKEALGGLITIVIIMGGIYSGIFTPTESGGVAAVYSIILCCFIYRTLSAKGFKKSILETVRINSMIMFIVIGATLTGQVVLMAQIPHNLLAFVKAAEIPSWAVILLINVFLIIMGGPLEAITILVITLPILYPLVIGLGFSGLWFAVIMLINMELALISPPEGLVLFILQDLAKATANEVWRGVLPFLVVIALFLLLISLVPSLTNWLPALIMK
jgi:C4-dicarboxylate transporter, DctM subunit